MTDAGYVQVYTAPPSTERPLAFPLLTIHLVSESPLERGVGESLYGEDFTDFDGEAYDSEGWLARVQVNLIAWSLNPDERLEMRKILRRLLLANLPVLAAHGLTGIDISMQDVDAVSGEYDAPIFQVAASLTCCAPAMVRAIDPAVIVESVTVTASATQPT